MRKSRKYYSIRGEKVIITLGARGSLLCEHAARCMYSCVERRGKMPLGPVTHNGALAAALARQRVWSQPFSMPPAFALLWRWNKSVRRVCLSTCRFYIECVQSNKVIHIN